MKPERRRRWRRLGLWLQCRLASGYRRFADWVASSPARQVSLIAACVGVALVGGWFGRPTKGAPPPVAVQLAGSHEELGRVIAESALSARGPAAVLDAEPDCRPGRDRLTECRAAVSKVERDLRRDFGFIVAYGFAGLMLCGFAGWRAGAGRRRRFLFAGAWAVGMVAVLDVAENVALFRALAQHHEGGFSTFTVWVQIAAGVAVAKWATVPLLILGVLYAVRAIWTCRAWPTSTESNDAVGQTGVLDDGDCGSEAAVTLDRKKRWEAPEVWQLAERGICFSGGGIRSAAFCLGALQRLQEAKGPGDTTALSQARYLSAVSGGGYLAGAFQLLARKTTGASTFQAGSPEEDHLRRHGSYLADSSSEWASALSQAIGKLLGNLLIVAAVIWVVAQPLGWAGRLFLWTATAKTPGPWPDVPQSVGFALAGLGLFAISCAAARRRYSRGGEAVVARWRARRSGAAAALALVLGTAASVLAATALVLPFFDAAGSQLARSLRLDHGLAAGSWPTALVVAVLTKVVKNAFKREAGGDISGNRTAPKKRLLPFADSVAEVVAGPLLMVVAVGYLSFFAAEARAVGPYHAVVSNGPTALRTWALPLLVITLVLGGGRLVDAVDWSMHRFYKRRLWSAFAYDPERAGERDWGDATTLSTDGERLIFPPQGDRGKAVQFPELVLCGAAQVSGASLAPPGRRAVTWTFDSDWVGGPEIGWCRTADMESVMAQRRKPQDVTLFGAMAISGAAFGSAMGRHSRGTLNSVFALANARLGVWLPNPRHLSAQRRHWEQARAPDIPADDAPSDAAQIPPVDNGDPSVFTEVDLTEPAPNGHGSPGQQTAEVTNPWPEDERWKAGRRHLGYVAREVFGRYSPDAPWILVSDGGHYENLGLIELFRRRCTKILCFDASGASGGAPTTVAEALRLAEEELGVAVKVTAPWSSLPGQADPPLTAERLADALDGRLAQESVLIGSVLYPPEAGLAEDHRQGWLVVGRAVMDSEVPWSILSYAAGNGEFPNDSTGDQWFDHDQFANYRLLGRYVAGQVLETITTAGWWDPVGAASQPPDASKVRVPVDR